MAVNDQYTAASKFFSGLPQGTGADGSPPAMPGSSEGPVIGSPVVTVPGSSSQAAQPSASVNAGDTGTVTQSAGYADADPLTGVTGQGETGAGQGSAGHFRHPSAGRPM